MTRALALRHVVVPAAGAALVAGASLLLLAVAVPRATAEDRIAVRILRQLETTRGAGSVMRLAGTTLHATCERTRTRRSRVVLSDGTTLHINRTRVVARRPAANRGAIVQDGEFVAAAADLSGSHALYVAQLAGSIVRGRDVVVGETRVGDRRAYVVRLGRPRPRVELLVDRLTLRPLVARYRSRRPEGSARLVAGGAGRGC